MTGAKQVFAPRHPPSILAHDDPQPTPELVGQNKFAVTWPAEPSPPIQSPLAHPLDRSTALSSSEGDSDVSEREFPYNDKLSQAELSDEYDTSPNHRRNFQQQFAANTHDGNSDTPRLSRTFSAPLPSQLEHLHNPRRAQAFFPLSTSIQATPDSPDGSQFHEVSLELADSVEMAVQMLLQISPPQILDPVREQYAACSLSVPTSSMSALLTTMKNLNFMSANMAELYSPVACTTPQAGNDAPVSLHPPRTQVTLSDFDVGEMLQGVGDAMSGCAAQRGVDLVIFHADNGLRHVAVRGEELAVCSTLTHVVRQVLHTAQGGDTIDVGLSVRSLSDDSSESPMEPKSARLHSNKRSNSEDGYLRCTFEISHYFIPPETSDNVPTPTGLDIRPRANVGSPLLQRLCSRTGASLVCDLPVREPLPGRAYEVAFLLEHGSATAITAKATPVPENCSQLSPGARITKEPSLEELVQFSETLRGKKATLYAKESSAFAHHLTSYLTTWGMDVSHLSSESEADGPQGADEKTSSTESSPGAASHPAKPRQWNPTDDPSHDNAATAINGTRAGPTFIFIDDDVSVLRERIHKDRVEMQPPPVAAHSRGKRPSLAAHHRPKSSPQIARALGYGPSGCSQTSHIIVHFASLVNYKIVKDIVQTELAFSSEPFLRAPLDIMVIPKPAGPRRFLTALHTAITRPVVDPLFSPIATSPMSPGIHSLFSSGQTTPKSPPSRPPYSPRTTSERVRSPRDGTGEPHALHPPSPLAISETAEYFPDGPVKLGVSPASGLVISSPDGQPAGIVFQPRAKGAKGSTGITSPFELPKSQFLIPAPDRVRRPPSRRPSSSEDKNPGQQILSFSTFHSPGPSVPLPYRQDSLPSPDSQTPPSSATSKGKVRKPSVLADDVSIGPSSWKGNPAEGRKMASPPGSPNNTDPPPHSLSRRQSRRGHDQKSATPPITSAKAGKTVADTNFIPPISVLIVDDNPINQTILSTFMRKKKIKYDVAKNGEEAVQKWRTGVFHLILMDIQMPVMDGIQATKEIRQLENLAVATATPQTRTPTDVEPRIVTPSASPHRTSVIIVALTASSLQSDRVAALEAGCNDFLTKPVSLQWLNNKIIEWGSIKALQMWADLRPEAAKTISTEQTAQAQVVARRLHVPEGRATPLNHSPSRSSSMGKIDSLSEAVLVSSTVVLDPSEKLDAIRKLRELSPSAATSIAAPVNKHEGDTVSSPVTDAAAIADDADKPPPTARSGSDSNLSGSLSRTTEGKENTGEESDDLPTGSNVHGERGKIP